MPQGNGWERTTQVQPHAVGVSWGISLSAESFFLEISERSFECSQLEDD